MKYWGIYISAPSRGSARQLGNVSDMSGWPGSMYYFGKTGYVGERITLNDKGKYHNAYWIASVCGHVKSVQCWSTGLKEQENPLQCSVHLTFRKVGCCTSLWTYKITELPQSSPIQSLNFAWSRTSHLFNRTLVALGLFVQSSNGFS